MKHLLNGVAVAAVLALAAPALAQNAPMTPSTPPAAAPAPKAPAATTPTAKKPVHHMVMRHRPVGGGDQMTEQLNQQELARITGSGAPPAAPAPMPSNYQTPGKSDVAPAPGNMAPPPPASK
jgi:hypothetical protein